VVVSAAARPGCGEGVVDLGSCGWWRRLAVLVDELHDEGGGGGGLPGAGSAVGAANTVPSAVSEEEHLGFAARPSVFPWGGGGGGGRGGGGGYHSPRRRAAAEDGLLFRVNSR